ncbi:SLATT domain-containing protein [Cohnella suwonensis]|uniref:SLATT domain-containing protein n=1 Tax=Cohnella suwonensis TaxID=696072 RepID=A0ABW0LTV3_9BACL
MNDSNNIERLESLLNKVWLTRKARIKAEERLEQYDFLAQILLNYYTLVITGLSIWCLYDSSNAQLISVLSIIASVLLFGLSIFVTSRNFKGRALAFKSCYIKLDEIYNEGELFKSNISALTTEDLTKLQKKYNEVIYSVENHTPIDYLNVLQNANKIGNKQYVYLLWRKVSFVFFISAVILVPLILVYFVVKA